MPPCWRACVCLYAGASRVYQVLHAAFFIIQFQKCNAISNTFQTIFAFRSFIPNSPPIWFFIRFAIFRANLFLFYALANFCVSTLIVYVFVCARVLLSRVACCRFRYSHIHILGFWCVLFLCFCARIQMDFFGQTTTKKR